MNGQVTCLKILVFSDSHHSLSGMYWAIDKESPQQVIHLGDCLSDVQEVAEVYPQLPICTVPGNCDGWTPDPIKKLIMIDGVRFLLGHGHHWGVKHGYDLAVSDAHLSGADVLLFGHTHVPLCKRLEDGLWILNPGSARSSFGRIIIQNGTLLECPVCPIE